MGHYVGKISVTQRALDMAKEKGFESQMEAEVNRTKIDLVLKPDATFLMTNSDVQSQKSTHGTWAYSKNQIVLTPSDARASAPKSTDLKLTVSADGKTLTADQSQDPAAAALASLTFTKS